MLLLEPLDARPWSALREVEIACYGEDGWDDYSLRMHPILHAPLSTIAFEDDAPVGYAVAARAEGEGGVAWILGIAVVPEARGRGHAGRLLDRTLDRARAGRIERLRLTVGPENEPARRLYAARGFVELRREESFFGTGQPRLLLGLTL